MSPQTLPCQGSKLLSLKLLIFFKTNYRIRKVTVDEQFKDTEITFGKYNRYFES